MNKLIGLLISLIFVSGIFAQPGGHRAPNNNCQPGMRMEERGMRNENRDEMLAFRFTEILNLSTEQADKFFPRFREHQEVMEKIRKESFDANNAIQDKIKDGKEISDTELNKALKSMNDTRNKLDAEREKFIESLGSILDNTQLAKLVFAPQHFAHERMMERNQRPQNRK